VFAWLLEGRTPIVGIVSSQLLFLWFDICIRFELGSTMLDASNVEL
jgi:hypothetical protein